MISDETVIKISPAPVGFIACYERINGNKIYKWEKRVVSIGLVEYKVYTDPNIPDTDTYVSGLVIGNGCNDDRILICEREEHFVCYKNENEVTEVREEIINE